MVPVDKPKAVELSKKRARQVAGIAGRIRRWGNGLKVKEAILLGQIPVKVRARLQWDGARIKATEVSVSTPSKEGFQQKVLAGPVGELIRATVGDRVTVRSFCPKLAELWAKGERQMAGMRRRLAKVAEKLKVEPDQLLARYAMAPAGKAGKAKKASAKAKSPKGKSLKGLAASVAKNKKPAEPQSGLAIAAADASGSQQSPQPPSTGQPIGDPSTPVSAWAVPAVEASAGAKEPTQSESANSVGL